MRPEKTDCTLVEISVLRASWRLQNGQERVICGSALASNWRIHLSFNDRTFATRPLESRANMVINEFFVSALRSSLVGILLIEVRNLLDVSLAMGGIEVSSEGVGRYASPEGADLQMSGPVIEGSLTLRVVVREGVSADGNDGLAGAPALKRAKKLQRSHSTGDVVNGSCLLSDAPDTTDLDGVRMRVEPLAVECR